MSVDLLLVRDGTRLSAADGYSAELIDGLPKGKPLTCRVTQARNPAHHRKFMAMVGAVFGNQGQCATKSALLTVIKVGIGHCQWATLPGPVPMRFPVPDSISFARMDQADFEAFYDRAVQYVLRDILPGCDKGDLEREVLSILAGRNP